MHPAKTVYCKSARRPYDMCMPFDDRLRDAFLAVARHGSIGRAAEHLNVSQPTLSRMIRRLELRAGVPLFDRFATGMSLNLYGEALLPFADRIETESNHALDEIDRLRTGSIGTLRIGSAISVGRRILPKVFSRMTAANPRLRIEMLEGVQDTLEPALFNRQIDLVIAAELPKNDDIHRLDVHFEDYGSVIAGADHPLRALQPLTLDDCRDALWVMPPESTQPRRGFERVIREQGARIPRIAVETWSIAMMKALVAESGFLSWLPHPIYEIEQKAGLISELDVAGMTVPRKVYIYRRKSGVVPPAVRTFIELVRELPEAIY